MNKTMDGFFTWLEAFLNSGSFLVYVVIFIGKVAEVSMGTLRIVLINRGERLKGSLIAFVEIIFWLVIASSVLDGWKDDVFKGLAYAVAYATGNYAGSRLDELLAFGLSSLQIVVPTLEETKKLSIYLQSLGYGITSLDAKGRNADDRCILLMMIKRKNLKAVMEEIQQYCPAAMITVSDIKTVRGGYMRSGGKRRGALNK